MRVLARRKKNEMIRVQVARRTKAALQEIAQEQCRTLSNLCLVVLTQDRVGDLRLGNDERRPRAASAPVSPDVKSARINFRSLRELKDDLQRQAETSGQSLSAYCRSLFEDFAAAHHTCGPGPPVGRTERRPREP